MELVWDIYQILCLDKDEKDARVEIGVTVDGCRALEAV